MPATRISEHMIHAGFLVKDRAAEDRFFRDTLGFDEMWHGGKTETSADWISMRVPDGEDWLEYMCNVRNPTLKTRGVMNHVAFGVPEMDAGSQNPGVAAGADAGETEDRPRRQMATQSLRSKSHSRRTDGTQAGGDALLLGTETAPRAGGPGRNLHQPGTGRRRHAGQQSRVRSRKAGVPHHGGRRQRLGYDRRVLLHLVAHDRRSHPGRQTWPGR